jgi:hypothetical protein
LDFLTGGLSDFAFSVANIWLICIVLPHFDGAFWHWNVLPHSRFRFKHE